jgi:hypothetical protein
MTSKISRRSFLGSVAAVAFAPVLPARIFTGGGPAYMFFEGIQLSNFGSQMPIFEPITTTLSWPGAEITREVAS